MGSPGIKKDPFTPAPWRECFFHKSGTPLETYARAYLDETGCDEFEEAELKSSLDSCDFNEKLELLQQIQRRCDKPSKYWQSSLDFIIRDLSLNNDKDFLEVNENNINHIEKEAWQLFETLRKTGATGCKNIWTLIAPTLYFLTLDEYFDFHKLFFKIDQQIDDGLEIYCTGSHRIDYSELNTKANQCHLENMRIGNSILASLVESRNNIASEIDAFMECN